MVTTSKGYLYTGISTDVEKRVATHNKGKGAKSLRGQLPVTLLWYAGPMHRRVAASTEAAIKKMSHEKKLDYIGIKRPEMPN